MAEKPAGTLFFSCAKVAFQENGARKRNGKRAFGMSESGLLFMKQTLWGIKLLSLYPHKEQKNMSKDKLSLIEQISLYI